MSSLQPLSEISPEKVFRYLQERGMSRDVIEWKYFDDAFNRHRNRGWVWMLDEQVCGFLGQIPCWIARGTTKIEAHWFCDWSIDARQKSAGAGQRLWMHAMAACSHPMAVGGNSISIPLLDRMAARTDFHATCEYRRILRLAPLLQAAQKRLPFLKPLQKIGLGAISVARLGKRGRAWFTTGVSPQIEPLLEAASDGRWTTFYDLDFLRWQIERCPQLQSVTVCDREQDPRIALVAWTHAGHAKWRFALWQEAHLALPVAQGVVLDALAHLSGLGATQVSCIASRGDDATTAILKAAGFALIQSQRPLFFYDNALSDLRLSELQRVNFLAADLGHRF